MTWIITPFIGAIIGYITNHIAVKMLFHPRKAIKLGNFTLPFTPGIIPKERDRLAQNIGGVVSKELLSKEALQEVFLSGAVKEKVSQQISQFIERLAADQRTVKETLTSADEDFPLVEAKNQLALYLSERITSSCLEASVGTIIADLVLQAVKENFQGGFLSMMLNDSLLQPIAEKIDKNITTYLEENGQALIMPMVEKETDDILDKKICDLVTVIEAHGVDLAKLLLSLYDKLIQKQMESILDSIPFATMIENQIKQMDIITLEQLILSVMKKELRAVVNLGALIGFLLGLMNLFF